MPTPTTRSFRATLPDRVVDSNLQSGLGQRRQYEPGTQKPYGTGMGYGTGIGGGTGMGRGTGATPVAPVVTTPSAAAPVAKTTGLTRAPSPGGVTPGQLAERAAVRARAGTPNAGGTITRAGVTTKFDPSAAANRSPARPNLGGTMTREVAPGVNSVTKVPPSPAAALATPPAAVATPTTVGAPQSESNNPLTGDTNDEAEETTEAVDPGQALGLNQRGSSLPRGTDAVPKSGQGGMGGTGLYARQFANPKSAGLYDSYVRKIFGDGGA